MKGAQLTYPLTTIRSFCHDLVETYSHYVYPTWVDPYPQVLFVHDFLQWPAAVQRLASAVILLA